MTLKHYYDPQYHTEQEHESREDYWSSLAEWDRMEAEVRGQENPDRAWILTGNDVWHRNPYYHGPEVPHPEDGEYGPWTTVPDEIPY